MTSFSDGQGNAYTLQYNAAKQVTKITEPAGRFLSVSYKTVTANRGNFANLTSVTTSPSSGQWVELPVNNSTAYRYVRLLAADGSYGNIAEVEFYEAKTGAKLTGTVISSESLDEAKRAFDGDPATRYLAASQSGSYVGLDLGSAKKIGKVRILAAQGKEASMVPTGWGQQRVMIQGCNTTPASVTVVDNVVTSDGRRVDYEYTAFDDPTLPYVYPTLTGALYGDGTRSHYGYMQIFAGTRPLVTDWDDVRCPLPQARYKTVYQNKFVSTVLGMVDRQVNPDTGGTILSIGTDNGNLHAPTATYANGGTVRQGMSGGLMTSERDANGKTTTYTYDANGLLASQKDPLGHVTSFVRNGYDSILQQTNPDGGVVQWTRNDLDSVTACTDTLGHVTTYTRDQSNRITKIAYPDGTSEQFTYNNFSQPLTRTLRNGGVESFVYDARGLLSSKTDALGNVTSYGYDAADRLASVTDALGRTAAMQYSERGLVTQITYPDGSSKIKIYNTVGDLVTETNELGNTWNYRYDIFHRVIAVADPLGRVTQSRYLADSFENKPLVVTLPSGKQTAFTYDLAWNPLSRTSGAGTADASTTQWTYDAANNFVTIKNGLGNVTKLAYDKCNRKASETDPLNHKTQWTYDLGGNIIKTVRPDNGVTTNAFDTMNRLVSSTDPAGHVTQMSYDNAGNLAALTDAKGNSYTYSYDLLNRRLSMSYPDSTNETSVYDAVGNMTQYTTRAGQIRTGTFDIRGREIHTTWSDTTPSITRTFDAAGRLLTLVNSASAISFGYDAANQLASETSTLPGQPARTVGYTYDADGNRASMTTPAGSVISYAYTGRDQVASITADGGPALATYAYDLAGNRTGRTLENNTATAYQYDTASRLTGVIHATGPNLLASYAYTLNAVGDRTSRAETSGTSAALKDIYTYDAIDQLTKVAYATRRTVSYAYDPVGNRTAVTDNGVTASYAVNALNQYTQAGSAAPGYDRNGNLTSMSGKSFGYDAQNRLITATTANGSATLTYDARNRCVSRTINGVTTYLYYDGWDLIEERNASGNLGSCYIHGLGTDEMLAKIDGTTALYYHQDGLGNVVALSDENGAAVERYTYDVFGAPTIRNAANTIITASTHGNRFLYTGREWLAELGLYDYRNRVYSAELGRFLQTDPIRFAAGDVSIYRYVGNNPIHRLDALGLCPNNRQKYDKEGWPIAQPVSDPVAENSGKLNYDEHGADTGHKTSGAIDENGNIVPPGTPGSRPLNSTDDFAVAPSDSGAKIGDVAQFTYPDGTTSTHQIGDIGPKGGEPEMSPGAGKNDGLDVGGTSKNPYPTQNGSDADIHVNVEYYHTK